MKIIPTDSIKDFFRDRTVAWMAGSLLLMVLAYIIYMIIVLEPSDLQIATRYTAFGETHFYRNKWYYLLSFILFSVSVLGLHVALAIKLHARQQRSLAIALLALTAFTMIIGWLITKSVIQIAFL